MKFRMVIWLFVTALISTSQAIAGDLSLWADKMSRSEYESKVANAKIDSYGFHYDIIDGIKTIFGPINATGLHLDNVRIVAYDTAAVYSDGGTTITNSTIEAPVCIQSAGINLHLDRDLLKCHLGVRFTTRYLINNSITNCSYSEQLSNKPDTF